MTGTWIVFFVNNTAFSSPMPAKPTVPHYCPEIQEPFVFKYSYIKIAYISGQSGMHNFVGMFRAFSLGGVRKAFRFL